MFKSTRGRLLGLSIAASLAVGSVLAFASDSFAQTTVPVPTVNQYDPTSGIVGVLTPYIVIVIGVILAVSALAIGPKLAKWGMSMVTGFFSARRPKVG